MTFEIKIIPAAIAYFLYLAGTIIFAVSSSLSGQGWLIASLVLALAVITYVSHDFINLSILKDWSVSLTLMDIALGVVVIGLSAVAGFYAARIYAG
ncbi:MAG TPA: DUF2177 family protein [Cellvibrio sp.]|nr:DUF2177 family protein [Cellvibrio sp.]